MAGAPTVFQRCNLKTKPIRQTDEVTNEEILKSITIIANYVSEFVKM